MSILKNLFEKNNSLLSEEEFTTTYFKAFQKKIPDAKLISYNRLELEIDLGNENIFKQFLDNAFAEYNNSPEEIEHIFDNYSNAVLNFIKEQNTELNPENIVPIIKNIGFIQSNIDLNPNFENDFLFEQLNDELYLFYAVNTPSTLQFLQKSDFDTLTIPRENLKDLAINNLKNISEGIQRQGDNGYYAILLDGTFEASVLLFDIWNKDNFDVKGDIIVAVPARDVLLVTGSEDKENLLKMKESTIDICQSGDHIISEKLFILKDGKLDVFA